MTIAFLDKIVYSGNINLQGGNTNAYSAKELGLLGYEKP